MSDPTIELQFTDEEIDHGVHALLRLRESAKRDPFGVGGEPVTEVVRTVLRAVRAVPARCLNGHATGQPAIRGTKVQGTGTNGRTVRGTVEMSYPVTTVVQTPEGATDYLWTNTIRSWDPSTEKVADQLGVGSVVLDPSVPDGRAWVIPEGHEGRLYDLEPVIGPPVAGKAQITISADQPETIEVTGPVTDPKVEGMHPIGINPATGGVVFVPDPALVADDDDGMPCEGDR
jgi:hypothetical protein